MAKTGKAVVCGDARATPAAMDVPVPPELEEFEWSLVARGVTFV